MTAYSRILSYFFITLLGCLCATLAPATFADVAYQEASYQEATYASLSDVGAGSLLLQSEQGYQPFVRSGANFQVQVNGLVSRVTLRQEFTNPGQDWVEAIYVLPLPDDSAVDHMRITIGERVIEGQIREKAEAKRIYTQAKAEGKRAGLLEQQRPNLFSTRVANIGPGETVAVELTFLHTLHYDQSGFSLRLPMTITPRYIPGEPLPEQLAQPLQGWSFPTTEVPDAHLITPPQTHQAPVDQLSASLQLDVNTGFEVAQFNAPYHEIEVNRLSDQYHISTRETQIAMDRDFVLHWMPVASQIPTAAYFAEPVAGKQYGMLMLLPPTGAAPLQIPPRRLILVVDSSGSMAGQSMEQAKQALQMALLRLRPEDQFNVIDFDDSFQQLFPAPTQATPAALQRASAFVSALVADGGTEMAAPLRQAMRAASGDEDSTMLTQIVFITDGSVGNEAALFDLIHQNIGRQRLYTVGIGSAPNAWFMRKAAEFGRGTYTYVGQTDAVQSTMAALFEKIEKPVLTRIEVQVEGAGKDSAAELYPNPIPDLFAGEPLLIKGRFDQPPTALEVKGLLQGQPWRTRVALASGQHAEGIASLWARAKITSLQDDGVRQGNPEQHRQEILQLGLQHRLLTPYTSFVAVDQTPVRPADADLKTGLVANRMPAGSAQTAPVVGYPQTALGLHGQMLLGLILLAAALLLWRGRAPGTIGTSEQEPQYAPLA